uniref:Uncharacterized protein n=1 Tax=Chrysotila carterae TaxID=13221 RepID=A0A7S4FAB8_CHRCT
MESSWLGNSRHCSLRRCKWFVQQIFFRAFNHLAIQQIPAAEQAVEYTPVCNYSDATFWPRCQPPSEATHPRDKRRSGLNSKRNSLKIVLQGDSLQAHSHLHRAGLLLSAPFPPPRV